MKSRIFQGAAPALVFILAVAALAYAPGLSGGFGLDDYANLSGLAGVRADRSAYGLAQFVLGGHSSQLGRPLSLLTFALQAGSWDQQPADFIAVNVALHLLNGALWYLLLAALLETGAPLRSRSAIVGATALWLFLPLHVATVPYVVQRMAMLATTCFLAGTLLYVDGRARAATDPRGGYARIVLGLFIGTVLGTLCKETAAVMPMMLLALEATLLRSLDRPAHWKPASIVLLWLPAAALVAYLGWQLPAFLAGYGGRTFTLSERLLTESRVLFVYLQGAFLPSMGAVRVFYDDLPLSTTWLEPWTTAVAVIAWITLAVIAVRFRARFPVFALALAWYLVGNLLEGSVVPLEIAFSHRSYLPLLGPALAAAIGLHALASRASGRGMRGFVLGAGAVYGLLLVACVARASVLWGEPLAQAKSWMQAQPESQRVVLNYGHELLRNQDLDTTYRLYRAAWAMHPDDAVYGLAVFELSCLNPRIRADDAALRRALREYDGAEATVAVGMIEGTLSRMQDGACPDQAPAQLLPLIDTMLDAPAFATKHFSLLHASAMTLELLGDKRAALARIEQALALDPQVPVLQQAIQWSVQLGDTRRARAHLQTAETSRQVDARSRWLYRREIAGMRQLIEMYESLPGEPAP